MSSVPTSLKLSSRPPSAGLNTESTNSSTKSVDLNALDRRSRRIMRIMLAWAFVFPSIHYYLGQIPILSGSTSLSIAGLLDLSMFGLGILTTFVYAIVRRTKPHLFVLIILYFASQVFAWMLSPIKEIATRQFVNLNGPVLFYLSLVMLAQGHNLSKTVARVLVLSSLVPMAVGILQFLSQMVPTIKKLLMILPIPEGGLDPYPGLPVLRVPGPTWEYNQFAVFLSLLLLAVFLNLYNFRSRGRQWLWLVAAVSLLFATLMRGVWIGFVSALGVLFLFANPNRRKLIIVVSGLLLLIVFMTPVAKIANSRLSDPQTWIDRQALSNTGWGLFFKNPIGYGTATSGIFTLQTYNWVNVMQVRGDVRLGYIFHNEYVQSAVEGGIFQLCTHLLLLAGLLAAAVRSIKLAKVLKTDPKWGVWLLSATVFVIISGYSSIGLTASNFVWWGLVAAAEMEYRAMKLQLSDIRNANIYTLQPNYGK